MGERFAFRAGLWRHAGDAAWHFVTVPHDVSDDIEELTAHRWRGFGSVRVQVTVGSSSWATSLFPDTKAGAYVLPVKKPVRLAEGIGDGDTVRVTVELLDP